MKLATYTLWAELGLLHADPNSPEVAVVRHLMDEEREIDNLIADGRMVAS